MIDWSRERVVVTGGAGFIGSHLVDALVGRGTKEVVVVDNFCRGGWMNIGPAMKSGRVKVRQLNLTNQKPAIWPGTIVFHLAARITNIEANQKDHLGMMQANLAINNSITEAVQAGAKLYIPISTVCVYPHDAPVPTPENAGDACYPEPTNEGYGIAKWVQEKQAQFLHDELGIPAVVPRFSNAIGLRDYYDWQSSHVVPALIRKAHEHEEIVVWGTGQQTRSFIDAKDIAKALIMLAEMPEAHDGRPVNIGHDREISMAELVFLILKLADLDVPVRFDTSKPDGHKRRAVDNSRLKRLIGWAPDTPLEDTIAAMIDEYRTGRAHV